MAEDIKKDLDNEAVTDTEGTVDETTKTEDAATDAQADEKDARERVGQQNTTKQTGD